ncbi:MAG TPA: hypothetical protein PKA62_01240 [Thermoanaerobaculia bacterium]|nr:hypothetical protein [Thermoanaerobaculia bacterium]
MGNVFSPAVTESVRSVERDARKMGQDVKSELQEAAARGHGLADRLASDVRAAAGQLSDRAKETFSKSRRRASRAVDRVSDYADENTALVTLAVLGVGLLVGALAARRR